MKFEQLLQKAFIGGHWGVGIREKGAKQYHMVNTPAGAWIADPFLYEVDGEHYLFVELYETDKEKACIAYYRFVDGKPVYQGKIIEQPYHMSYPCVFAYNGEHYMIPETSANLSIDIYKAVDFPERWEKIACLSSGKRYVDTTVLKQGDNYKLISYRKDGGSWYLDAYTLDMEKKTIEPLASKSYATNIGRPAGHFMTDDGLIRPAQNCAIKYGESIILYQIDHFENGCFEEHATTRMTVADLDIDARPDRVHTYNRDSQFECVDVYFEKFDLLHGVKTLWRAYLKKYFVKH